MLIVCPHCATSYNVPAAALGADGRSVRCARCRTVWAAGGPAQASAAEVAAGSGLAVAEASESAGAASTPDGSDAPSDPPSAAQDEDMGLSAETAGENDVSTPEAVEAVTAPSLVPEVDADAAAVPSSDLVPDNVEILAERRARRASGRRKERGRWRPGISSLVFLLAALVGALLVFRQQVVRVAPQTASLFRAIGMPVNVRGLVIDNLKTSREVHKGIMVMVIEGTVSNITGRKVELPKLRFALRNGAGHEIYAWTSSTGRTRLDPGEEIAFETRLASPPADGRDVIVRFFSRQDAIAGFN